MANRIKHTYESSIEWLPAKDIEFPVGVAQREYDPNFGQYIADNFDPDLLGYPVICEIGAHRYGVDGQHRIKGAMLALGDDQQIQCEVIKGVSLQRAAQIFRGRNKKRSVTPLALFLTGLTGKDKVCMDINRAVEATGWHVAAGLSHGAISAVSSLTRIYKLKNDATLVSDVLDILHRAWGYNAENAYGDFMVGTGMFLHRYPGVDKAAFTKRLQGYPGPMRIVGTARGLKEALGGSMSNSIARTLVTIYNSGRRMGKVAEWGSQPAAEQTEVEEAQP